jgi:ABC-2 type transport system permease protein
MGQSWVMRSTLTANLLDNDPERIQRFLLPMAVETKPLTPARQQRDEKEKVPFAIPYATAMLTVLVVLMSSGLLLHSIAGEKKNQVMEVLMVSVSPRQMLRGKIIGLGMLGLLQAVVWIGTGYVLLRVGGRPLNLPLASGLRISMLVWGIVFFLLGYAIYASLMAGLGAVVQNVKEASQSTIVVIWPMVLVMLLIRVLIEHPHGTLATALSLFPLTAPVAMMTRLAAGGVPFWQPLLAMVLLLVAAWFIVRTVAGMFHAQLLLSGQPFSTKRFLGALLKGIS